MTFLSTQKQPVAESKLIELLPKLKAVQEGPPVNGYIEDGRFKK
jgi:hypothetical protein